MVSLELDRPDAVVFAGVVLAVLSSFLAWRVAADTPGGAAAVGYEGVGFLTVVAALAVFATAAVLRHERTSALVAVAGGAVVVGVAGVEYVRLGAAVRPGIGLSLAVVAGLVLAAGGVLGVRRYD
ncbi:hypothetical protein [Haloarcula litorea]|uniref:hypothetical protein n=1 Tax=Haloarcula litorea TaxID=3032579 RepID=UPI0023E8E652|nr:hypothetical protein [Halomicroarcula sp. GDY20]